MKTAKAEKQIYNVILLMLAKAVKEYDLFCLVVMETLNNLNGMYIVLVGKVTLPDSVDFL